MPNLKKLGLLDAADGWLRTKFTEMGAIAFENLTDSTEEEDAFADGSPADSARSPEPGRRTPTQHAGSVRGDEPVPHDRPASGG